MATTYPTTIQTIPNPSPTDLLENASATLDHDYQHKTVNDTLAALQAKVGVDGSAVNTSHDYKLSGVATGDKAVSKTGIETLTNKTLTAPQFNFGSDAGGDMIYRGLDGVTKRLAIGSANQILSVDGTGIPVWIANPSAADASTTVKGVVEEATQAEADAGTAVGGTGARLFLNPSTAHPVGTILMYGGATSPTKWLICDGSAVSRTTYAALFAVIGTTYGSGDGSTTFNLPDMRGRVPMGAGTGTGGGASGTGLPSGGSALTARALGAWKGKETHALSVGELPSSHSYRSGNGNNDTRNSGAPDNFYGSFTAGSDTAHENMQPSMTVNFIIRF